MQNSKWRKENRETRANSSMNNNRHCRVFEINAAGNKILNYILLQEEPLFEIKCEQAILE